MRHTRRAHALSALTIAATLLAASSAALLAQTPTAAPARAAALRVTDLAGQPHTLPAAGAKATVLLFVSKDCPYSNAAAPEMARIAKQYAAQGFDFFFVYGSPYTTASQAKQHAAQYGFAEPAILDNKQSVVRAADATTTPEAVILNPAGKMLYRGRIDNRFSSVGVQRTVVTQHDLTDALDAVAAGKAPAHAYERPVGCSIPSP